MLKKFILIFLVIINISIFANEKKEIDVNKLSETIGQIIGKNLDEFGIELDLKNLVKGIKKAANKKSSPINEQECLKALNQIQQMVNDKISAKNLKAANDFLTKNASNKDIFEIEKKKLQYKILKNGKTGSLQSYHTPIVKLKGKYLDGRIFTKMQESLILAETLPSLQKAIIGMKENEKRRIFIHPDLFVDADQVNLNSLVIFDIKIINLDTKKKPLDHIAHQKAIF